MNDGTLFRLAGLLLVSLGVIGLTSALLMIWRALRGKTGDTPPPRLAKPCDTPSVVIASAEELEAARRRRTMFSPPDPNMLKPKNRTMHRPVQKSENSDVTMLRQDGKPSTGIEDGS